MNVFYKVSEYLKHLPSEIRMFIQRGKRGYADSDLCDLDLYLSQVIRKSISELEKTSLGYPKIKFPEIDKWTEKDWVEKNKQEIIKNLESEERLKDEDYIKYRLILRRIAWDFKEQEGLDSLKETTKNDKYKKVRRKEGFHLLCKYFETLWS